MRFLRDTPIKRKLTFVIMLTSILALLLACLTFIVYEQMAFRTALVRDFTILADMFDDNVVAGLAFDDSKAMEQTLKTLNAHPHITAAAVYDKTGAVVARHQRGGLSPDAVWPTVRLSGCYFGKDRLHTFQRIVFAHEMIGTVYIQSDLKEIDERLHGYALIVVVVLLVSSLAAFFISKSLRGFISEPILQLAATASRVASENNYSIRVVKHGEDELGSLIDRFNEMLEQIQQKDGALMEANDNLERRVEARTAELEQQIVERKRVEEERNRFFIASADLLCVVGTDGNFHRLNPTFERLLGFPMQELLHRPYLNVVHPEDRAATVAQVEKLAQGLTVKDFEIRCLCSDGSHRWITWNAVPLVGDGQFYASGRDMTERKEAEAKLEEVHKRLIQTSRQAGMAEVATGVLHNVGNVLNSVNVSATLVAECVRKSKAPNLSKIAALFRERSADVGSFIADDPKGKQLPGYLAQLGEHLVGEQQGILKEMELLRKNIEHIKDIVSMQQNYAKVSGVTEVVNVSDLVEDSLSLNSGALTRHGVELIRDYAEVPPITVEKHKVLQILVNIIRNAKYACDHSGRADKQVIVQVRRAHDIVAISVKDNGVGIPPENLTRIFGHGFTTRKDGHGFGLHSGALAAREMGGSLSVHSDGVGQGATFTLELPLHPHSNTSILPVGKSPSAGAMPLTYAA